MPLFLANKARGIDGLYFEGYLSQWWGKVRGFHVVYARFSSRKYEDGLHVLDMQNVGALPPRLTQLATLSVLELHRKSVPSIAIGSGVI